MAIEMILTSADKRSSTFHTHTHTHSHVYAHKADGKHTPYVSVRISHIHFFCLSAFHLLA